MSLRQNFYDGITFDFEGDTHGYDDPINSYYLDVVNQTTQALKVINSHYQGKNRQGTAIPLQPPSSPKAANKIAWIFFFLSKYPYVPHGRRSE